MAAELLHKRARPHAQISRETYIFFDMSEVCRLFVPRHVPIQVFQPVVYHWIIMPDCAKIAFEVLLRQRE